MVQAVRRCLELLVAPPSFAAYRTAWQQSMDRLHTRTALIEQTSIDAAFLDVTARGAPGEALAAQLQATIRPDLTLSCLLGVASNTLVPKVVIDVGKSLVGSGKMPQVICVVPSTVSNSMIRWVSCDQTA